MNNTKRSLIFGASILISTFLYVLMLMVFPKLSLLMAFYISLYLFTPLFFSLVRKVYLHKHLKQGQEFFHVKAIIKHAQLRALLYVIIIITQYQFYNTLSDIKMYLTILTFIIITEVYLYLTNKFTKIAFYNRSIIVCGTDFRIDLPLNDYIQSTSGVYSYSDFDMGTIKGQALTLEMRYKRGTLSFILPEDKAPHIISFIQSKGIELEKL